MFYERFVQLCKSRGVSPSRAALDAGLSKSTVTKWKNDPNSRPTGNVIEKLTAYFNISVAQLLDEPDNGGNPRATEEDIRFALFGGDDEVTREMYEEVLTFAAFVKEKHAKRKE